MHPGELATRLPGTGRWRGDPHETRWCGIDMAPQWGRWSSKVPHGSARDLLVGPLLLAHIHLQIGSLLDRLLLDRYLLDRLLLP